jgi:death-on-curing protein
MHQPQWVLDEVVLAIHKQQLAEHGGTSGIRDKGLLASALARPKNLFYYEPDKSTMPRLAAGYAFSLARNHPFVDGNKRVALVVSLLFLRLNGLDLSAPMPERYTVFMALAQGSLTEDELSSWFQRYCREFP